jgi:uncharacterized membrane protein YdjX (TVP38/TMEM64 family)
MPESLRHKLLAALPLVVLGVAAVLVLAIPDLRGLFTRDSLKEFLDRAGWWGPAAFAFIMAVAIVVSPIPNVPISAVLGMAYGALAGTAIAVTGAIVGAAAAFSIARHFGNRAIEALAGRRVRFCDGCSDRTLSTIVFVARLIPIVSFDVVSYGAGLSRMGFWRFILWSFLGMIPWTWFYTAFGSAVLDSPVLAAVLGLVLALAVLMLPALVRRYDPFGLRRVMMEQEEETDADLPSSDG